MKSITRLPVRAEQVQMFHGRGPWSTKSNARLDVPLALACHAVPENMGYRVDEIVPISPRTVRQRIFTVSGFPPGARAEPQVNERGTEIVAVIEGSVRMTCMDLTGPGVEEYTIKRLEALVIPPGVRHSMIVNDPTTRLLFVENTTEHDPDASAETALPIMDRQHKPPASIQEIRTLRSSQSRQTPLGAGLRLHAVFDQSELLAFFTYTLNIPRDERYVFRHDIRGERIYTITGIPTGTIGGTEFHAIRQELIIVTRGTVWLKVEDMMGESAEFTLEDGDGVWMPPEILHTYRALESDSDLLVVVNTLFDPKNPNSHDTYHEEMFREIQKGFTRNKR